MISTWEPSSKTNFEIDVGIENGIGIGIDSQRIRSDLDIRQSTCVHRRAGETEVVTIEIVILRREEPDAARVRPEARPRHLRKMLTIIVINIAL